MSTKEDCWSIIFLPLTIQSPRQTGQSQYQTRKHEKTKPEEKTMTSRLILNTKKHRFSDQQTTLHPNSANTTSKKSKNQKKMKRHTQELLLHQWHALLALPHQPSAAWHRARLREELAERDGRCDLHHQPSKVRRTRHAGSARRVGRCAAVHGGQVQCEVDVLPHRCVCVRGEGRAAARR